MPIDDRVDFWSSALWLSPVLIATVVFAFLFKLFDIDYWLADALYAWEA